MNRRTPESRRGPRIYGALLALLSLLWLDSPALAQQVSFQAPPVFSGDPGTIPVGVATGDFNGDGQLDFVVAEVNAVNPAVGQLVFYTGNPDGTFTPGAPIPINGTIAGNLYGTNHIISAGHFNGPAQPMGIAVALTTSPTCGTGGPGVYLLYSMPSLSTVAIGECLATAAAPTSIAVGDFNSDGFDDIAVSNPSGSPSSTASIYLNVANAASGQSGFAWYENLAVTEPNTNPTNVVLYGTLVAGNIGSGAAGTGLALLASTGPFTQYVDVLEPILVKVGTGPTILSFTWGPTAAAPPNGLNDLSIIAPVGSLAAAMLGLGTQGPDLFTVTLTSPPTVAAGTSLLNGAYIIGYALETADFDGNGVPDVAYFGSKRALSIALNPSLATGAAVGPFGPVGQALATGFSSALNQWLIVDAGVYLQTTPLFTQVTEARSIAPYMVSATTGLPTGLAPVFAQSTAFSNSSTVPAFAVADLDGTGGQDVAVLGQDPASFAATVTPFRNLYPSGGTGFAATPVIDLGSGSTVTGPSPTGYAMVAGKFRNATANPTGLPDLALYTQQGFTLLENLGGFQFALDSACVGAFTSTVTNCNLGSESHFPGLPFTMTTLPPIIAADVNGDGVDDLVMAVPENCNASDTAGVRAALYVFVSNGDGTFQPPVYYPSPVTNPVALAAGKLLGSGYPDILVANGGEVCSTALAAPNPAVALALLPNNHDGTGGLGSASLVLVQPAAVPYPNISSVAIADMNLDGHPDIVMSASDGLHVLLAPATGTCCFADQGAVPLYGATDTTILNAAQLAIGDFNRDGAPDVAAVIGGIVYVFENNGSGALSASAHGYASGANSTQAVAIDVNGDGAPDLLVSNSAGFAELLNTTPAGVVIGSPAHLTISASPVAVAGAPASNATIGVLVTNTGPAAASGVVITFTLPTGLQFVASSTSPSSLCTAASATQVVCSGGVLSSLAAGASTPIIPITVASTGSQSASYLCAFTATSALPEGTPATDNSITISVPVAAAPPPALTGVSPNQGVQGQLGLSLTLTGTNFESTGAAVSFGNAGITVVPGSLVVQSATTATVSVNIAATAALGPGSVALTTAAGQSTLSTGFLVVASAVTISVFEPIAVSDNVLLSDIALAEAIGVNDHVLIVASSLINIPGPIAYFSSMGLGFGGASGSQTVTLSNIGSASFTLSSVSAPSDPSFAISQIFCSDGTSALPDTLSGGGGACSFTITYTPPAAGNTSASITFNDTSGLSNLLSTGTGSSFSQTLSLSGAGTTAAGGPPPATTVTIGPVAETIQVQDTPALADLAVSESVQVIDTVSISVLNTPVGAGVGTSLVDPVSGVAATVSFATVTSAGTTSMTSAIAAPAAPNGFSLGSPPYSFDLSTTATYSGAITICINTTGMTFTSPPQLFHYAASTWTNVTTSFTGNLLCGSVTSLSPFAIFQPTVVAQTINFAALPAQTFGAAPFTLNATASSGLAVSFASTTPAVCTVSGSAVTLVAPGTCTIQASQAGNAGFSAAPIVTQSFNVAATVPGAPTNAAATAGNASASVVFQAPAFNGGAPIVGYTVTATPGAITATGTASPITVPGLVNGTAYTFTVAATNAVGSGPASQVSTAVVPGIAPVFTSTNAATFTQGIAANFTVLATGSPAPLLSQSGALPAGVTFNAVTGALIGIPTVSGTFPLTFSASNGVGTATQIFTLTVIVASGQLAPSALTYAGQQLGTVSTAQSVTLTNATGASVKVGSVEMTNPGFKVVLTTCSATLAAHSACQFSIAFAPNVAGTQTGVFSVGAHGSVGLTGTGVAPSALLAPSSWNFGNVQVGTGSGAQTFTYTNTGIGPITVASVGLGGSNPGQFALGAQQCTGITLQPGGSCNFALIFVPKAGGSKSANLTVKDTTGGAAKVVDPITGIGVEPAISLGSGTFRFGTVKGSATSTFMLSNTGTATFMIGSIAMANGTYFQVTGGSCLVGAVVLSGGTCTVQVTFSPGTTLSVSDTLRVSGSGVGVGAEAYSASRAMNGS